MKKSHYFLLLIILAIINSCVQKRTDDILPDDTDNQLESVEYDKETNDNFQEIGFDVNNILSGNTGNVGTGRLDLGQAPPFIVIYKKDSIFINYINSPNKSNTKIRNGQITITLANKSSKWRDIGAVLITNTNNLKIRSLQDSTKSNIVINGYQIQKNIRGGLATNPITWNKYAEFSLKSHYTIKNLNTNKIAENFVNQNRKFETTDNPAKPILTVTADSTNKIAEFGTNFKGRKYTKAINKNLVFFSCGLQPSEKLANIVSGKIELKYNNKPAIFFTFGFDSNNKLVTPSNYCDVDNFTIQWKNLKDEIKTYTYKILP